MNKIKKFFSDVKIEMKKVSWPTWVELKGSTFVVISFAIIISIFLLITITIIYYFNI